jgi:hypothetical protein
MSEHQKQTAFFKALVQDSDSPAQRQLRDRILKAEDDLRCCRRAMIRVLALVAVALIGGLYTLVIMPEAVLQHNHSLKKVFEVLTVGSLLSLVSFAGFWLYYRAVLFQVHSECRRMLFSMLQRNRYEDQPLTDLDFALTH